MLLELGPEDTEPLLLWADCTRAQRFTGIQEVANAGLGVMPLFKGITPLILFRLDWWLRGVVWRVPGWWW